MRKFQVGNYVPDAAAALSVGSAATVWLSTANEWAKFIATIIASVSGVVAIGYHIHKWRTGK